VQSLNRTGLIRPASGFRHFSLPDVPVIASAHPDSINTMTWGLVPFWVKDKNGAANIRMKTFNARAESIHEKPSFRHTIEKQRCLVLSDGFYEWQHVGKEKSSLLYSVKG
jgi:putative SOS response-associated peptidase YedK